MRDMLLYGKSHFREFLASPEGIASNILSVRLETLLAEGLLTKTADPANKSAAIYRPTQKALDLVPMLTEMIRWGIVYNSAIDKQDSAVRQALTDPALLRAQMLERFTI